MLEKVTFLPKSLSISQKLHARIQLKGVSDTQQLEWTNLVAEKLQTDQPSQNTFYLTGRRDQNKNLKSRGVLSSFSSVFEGCDTVWDLRLPQVVNWYVVHLDSSVITASPATTGDAVGWLRRGSESGGAAQLIKHQTGTLPTQVHFPGVVRDFSPGINF